MSYEYPRNGLNQVEDSAAAAIRWRDELVEDIQKLRESGDSSPQALELLHKLEQLLRDQLSGCKLGECTE